MGQSAEPVDLGMVAGTAVALTLVVIGLVGGGYFYYTKYMDFEL